MNWFKNWIKTIAYKIYRWGKEQERTKLLSAYKFDATINLGDVYIEDTVEIGKHSYINSGLLVGGPNSKVTIGKYCAFGRNIHIRSRTHVLERPTSDEDHAKHLIMEADINIGNYVWIGDNVLIKPGINVGDYAVIGANSVVIKDIAPFEIVGGVPAKHIRYNTKHYRYHEQKD